MAKKYQLRELRAGTVINKISKRQEADLGLAVSEVGQRLREKFPGLLVVHVRQWRLADVIATLSRQFPEVDFHYHHASSAMRPDGGILSIGDSNGQLYPVLIAEKKNQGTNDLRVQEGRKKQAKGNAIERLGKNVIGFRTALLNESIFPFVCFGDGCDFADDSSILDRVTTIAMFGHLNREYLHNIGAERFNRGSFYFREAQWTTEEMTERSYSIAEKSVFYYFSKYGERAFL